MIVSRKRSVEPDVFGAELQYSRSPTTRATVILSANTVVRHYDSNNAGVSWYAMRECFFKLGKHFLKFANNVSATLSLRFISFRVSLFINDAISRGYLDES